MKISNLTQLQQAASKPVKEAGEAQEAAAQQKQAASAPEAQDKVEVSRQARECQQAAEIAKASPEVRAEKVAALKEKIESGTYEVDSKELATKMIVDSLSKLT